MSVFDEARRRINSAFIESEFGADGAYWESGKNGPEFWTLNPLRPDDSKVGSFSISEKGAWFDFAGHGDTQKGDAIDLIASRDGITKKEAATYIVERCGGTVDEGRSENTSSPPRDHSNRTDRSRTGRGRKKDKPAAVVPVPSERVKDLNSALYKPWVAETYGKPVAGWRYHTADGELAFCVARLEKHTADGAKKAILPFYWDGAQWRLGQAFEDDRPLYNLPDLAKRPEAPVLVVEGEKCAVAGQKALPDYVVVTWAGGSKAITKTDWSPLEKRDVTIWPDADGPGIGAAQSIQSRIPHAKILNFTDASDGWDLADAVDEGQDPDVLIKETPVFASAPVPGSVDGEGSPDTDAGPFVALGYSPEMHFFLLKQGRILYGIPRGAIGRHLLELAPLSYWGRRHMVTDQGNVKSGPGTDYVIRLSEAAGRYEPETIRGAGVWREGDEIVVNDGRRMVRHNGEVVSYEDYQSANFYVSSDARFGDLAGSVSTPDEGWKLLELFRAQQFNSDAMAASALGWALISPFGGLLKWRPHIWLTGRKGAGKTFVVENLIKPLVGPFAYHGSGKDTEAGIRRSLRTDARPVILDEMEPRTKKEQEKIESKVELARNASSDTSGYITQAGKEGGVDKYSIRSCFAFASVQVPSMGAAIDSRMIRCEFRTVIEEGAKHSTTRQLIGLLDDAGRFRRRMFRMLPGIIRDIDYLRQTLPGLLSSQREADQVAPIVAALWSATHDVPLVDSANDDLLPRLLPSFQRLAEDVIEDEDRVVYHILQATIRTDENKNRTVAELLRLIDDTLFAANEGTAPVWAEQMLSRIGIRIIEHKNGEAGAAVRALAIATQSDRIAELLRDTPYASGYDAQLRRNALALSRETKQMRFAAGKLRARLFDWNGFKKAYMEDGQGGE